MPNLPDAIEIDFLPVGTGNRSGDAIAMRYRRNGIESVMIYDGGTQDSGAALIQHVRNHYGTNRVDHVVNSHPDNDHASGLSLVLEQMEVGALWIHRPWAYSKLLSGYFADPRYTPEGLARRFKDNMSAAHTLEKVATTRRIPIYEPYQGASIGAFVVLSPERNWYLHTLVPAFEKTPDAKKTSAARQPLLGALSMALGNAVENANTYLDEHWGIEQLREGVTTSAENDSSVVMAADFDGQRVLLTGDAGTEALHRAANYTEAIGHTLTTTSFLQVPHHGSRNNVTPSVLDRIAGVRQSSATNAKTAFVSASKESSTHPRKMVVNAFIRRGAKVIPTQGQTINWRHNYPSRGWQAATPLEFSPRVEAWQD